MTLTTRKLVFARDQFIDQNGRSAAHFRQLGRGRAPSLHQRARLAARAQGCRALRNIPAGAWPWACQGTGVIWEVSLGIGELVPQSARGKEFGTEPRLNGHLCRRAAIDGAGVTNCSKGLANRYRGSSEVDRFRRLLVSARAFNAPGVFRDRGPAYEAPCLWDSM